MSKSFTDQMKLRVGNRVRVNEECGTLAGKEGYLIPKTAIPMNDNGVPNLPGHSKALHPHEVGVKQDDGNVFIVYMKELTKLSED